jgi:hypothetical protein
LFPPRNNIDHAHMTQHLLIDLVGCNLQMMIGRAYSVASYEISYSIATSIYNNFVY